MTAQLRPTPTTKGPIQTQHPFIEPISVTLQPTTATIVTIIPLFTITPTVIQSRTTVTTTLPAMLLQTLALPSSKPTWKPRPKKTLTAQRKPQQSPSTISTQKPRFSLIDKPRKTIVYKAKKYTSPPPHRRRQRRPLKQRRHRQQQRKHRLQQRRRRPQTNRFGRFLHAPPPPSSLLPPHRHLTATPLSLFLAFIEREHRRARQQQQRLVAGAISPTPLSRRLGFLPLYAPPMHDARLWHYAFPPRPMSRSSSPQHRLFSTAPYYMRRLAMRRPHSRITSFPPPAPAWPRSGMAHYQRQQQSMMTHQRAPPPPRLHHYRRRRPTQHRAWSASRRRLASRTSARYRLFDAFRR